MKENKMHNSFENVDTSYAFTFEGKTCLIRCHNGKYYIEADPEFGLKVEPGTKIFLSNEVFRDVKSRVLSGNYQLIQMLDGENELQIVSVNQVVSSAGKLVQVNGV